MKLTAKQYAEVLVNVVSKAPAAAERFSESFWLLLKENRQEKLFSSIMRHAKKIWNEKHNIVEVTATVAVAHEEEQLISQLEKVLGKKVQLHLKVDPSIKGGIILQVDDSRYDASVSGRLSALARQFQAL
ncbi:MAG: ATP synthase F1 subunit delta [Candidatus Peregrinibacteria bacterium]|nr:ATP synthase F1 subunit delta [Candidatus Peregrinibacteria bacterium]